MKTTTNNEMFFVNYDTLERLAFQFVPLTTSNTREASIAEHKVVGRNFPEIQYLGGKTSMSFSVNLYGENVKQRATFFDQFTMKDSTNVAPPLLKIIWAGLISDNALWVVQNIKKDFSLFQPNDSFSPKMCVVALTLVQWTPENFTYNDMKV